MSHKCICSMHQRYLVSCPQLVNTSLVQIIALFFSARYICNVALNASMNSNERSEEIDQVRIKCGRSIPVHPSTARFHTIILHGRECAWNPDEEFKRFVVSMLKNSGYNPEVFGHSDDRTPSE
jgi:hypothetical protein